MHKFFSQQTRVMPVKIALWIILSTVIHFNSIEIYGQGAEQDYLRETKEALRKEWPKNRVINIVFHGHSVPAGYFNTPNVHTLESYPHLLLKSLKEIYPHAVINIIVTAIGGEHSVSGAARFNEEVLIHKPDIVCIDYALNDRSIGLAKAREATIQMIRAAQERNVKVILLTPSGDTGVDLLKEGNELQLFTEQLGSLAKTYQTGLADSYGSFRQKAGDPGGISGYMSSSNHPNQRGHQLIAHELLKWFR